jgi:two-component system phosphate regulon response regulator PhoB
MASDQLTSFIEKLKGKHILVVEDHPSLADVLLRLMRQYGIRVTHARDGKEAIKEIKTEAPDIILLDLSLPDMSGLEFARFVRRNEKTKLIPIIAMSGSVNARESSLQSGCNDFVQKPFRLPEMFAKIAKCLEQG